MSRAWGLGLLLLMASPVLAEEPSELMADKARVTPAQAERAALRTGAGQVHEIELRVHHGRPVYRVKFSDGRRVLVDAISGAVIRRDRPRPFAE